MSRAWKRVGVMCLLFCSAVGSAARGRADDHGDGAGAIARPAADIAGLYAWMTPGDRFLRLVMTVRPDAPDDAAFDPQLQYAIHVRSGNGLAADGAVQSETLIVCEFDAAGMIVCWAGASEHVSGDPSALDGLRSTSGAFHVFAGRRNDPFFFRRDGFEAARRLLIERAGPPDAAGCPAVDPALGRDLLGAVLSGGDTFAGQNVLAIAMEIDLALVTSGGPVLGIHATTHDRPVAP